MEFPKQFFSDNGPQYSSAEISNFAQESGFSHVTSSPKYPQSNRKAEHTVETMQNLLDIPRVK